MWRVSRRLVGEAWRVRCGFELTDVVNSASTSGLTSSERRRAWGASFRCSWLRLWTSIEVRHAAMEMSAREMEINGGNPSHFANFDTDAGIPPIVVGDHQCVDQFVSIPRKFEGQLHEGKLLYGLSEVKFFREPFRSFREVSSGMNGANPQVLPACSRGLPCAGARPRRMCLLRRSRQSGDTTI